MGRSLTRRLALAGGIATLLATLVAGIGFWSYRKYEAPGPLSAAAAVVVPRGGLEDVAAALQQRGVIDETLLFRIAALATMARGPLHAAEFAFPAAASLRDVLVILRTARPVQHRLTIPEGLTAKRVAELIDADDVLAGKTPKLAEGAILPETYSFERDSSREQLVDRARTAMDAALQKAWETRAPGLPLASKADALVLASMVERETAKPEERPLVAAVFINRLRLGMKLQSDPTVVYAASGGLGVLDHPITRSELDHDDPYNTYRIAGLPPGPICMPGLASLRAATQPAETDALYFVADGTGGHVFARTQDDHLRNVAHWRDIQRAHSSLPANGAPP